MYIKYNSDDVEYKEINNIKHKQNMGYLVFLLGRSPDVLDKIKLKKDLSACLFKEEEGKIL